MLQDGHNQQDCEIQAAKRWAEKLGGQGVTILGEDLFSREPFCRGLKEKHYHFILVWKPDSHLLLYQMVAFLAANEVLGYKVVRRWVGKYAEIATHRYANQLPLTGESDNHLRRYGRTTLQKCLRHRF